MLVYGCVLVYGQTRLLRLILINTHISDKFIRNVQSKIYIVYTRIYKNSCICKNNTANHHKSGHQVLRLTLRVNPLLRNHELMQCW